VLAPSKRATKKPVENNMQDATLTVHKFTFLSGRLGNTKQLNQTTQSPIETKALLSMQWSRQPGDTPTSSGASRRGTDQ
jgi:hypothetical protein